MGVCGAVVVCLLVAAGFVAGGRSARAQRDATAARAYDLAGVVLADQCLGSPTSSRGLELCRRAWQVRRDPVVEAALLAECRP